MSLFNFLKHKPKTDELATALTYMVARFVVENFNKKTEEEKFEIFYFLVFQIDKMFFDLNPQKRNELFDAFGHELFSSFIKEGAPSEDKKNALDFFMESYDERATIYANCNSLIGEKGGFPGKGSAIFALGYFLKRASGGTDIDLESIQDLLRGKGDVNEKNINAFLDLPEILELTMQISTIVIEIKKFLNKFRI
jgi:hypothetical protein